MAGELPPRSAAIKFETRQKLATYQARGAAVMFRPGGKGLCEAAYHLRALERTQAGHGQTIDLAAQGCDASGASFAVTSPRRLLPRARYDVRAGVHRHIPWRVEFGFRESARCAEVWRVRRKFKRILVSALDAGMGIHTGQ